MSAPRALAGELADTVVNTTWTVSSPTAELATMRIEDGSADPRIMFAFRREAKTRGGIAQRILGKFPIPG
jgi:hypothetical protein